MVRVSQALGTEGCPRLTAATLVSLSPTWWRQTHQQAISAQGDQGHSLGKPGVEGKCAQDWPNPRRETKACCWGR